MLANKSRKLRTCKRILLDLSHTYNSPHKTGIQRVVRSLLRELPAAARERDAEFEAVVCHDGAFVSLDSLIAPEQEPKGINIEKIRSDVVAHCPPIYRKVCAGLCGLTRSKQLRKWLLPEPGHQGIFKLPLRFLAACFGQRTPTRTLKKIEFSDSDLLILPDGYWVIMHVWSAIAEARKAGARVAVLVHDMICITHPQFFVPLAEKNFTEYLRAVNQYADVVATTSNTVKSQLGETLSLLTQSDCQATPPRLCSFRLGAEFSQANGEIRGELNDLLLAKGQAAYLMVSTFEPRKNHAFVLDAFELLWQTHPDCVLVFVGAVGWMSELLIERIQKHPQLNRRLFVFHDLSDAEVNFCYAHSKAVIFPSVVEGFGLPIVEALWHAKQTLVSDTPIHREVGGSDCQYFKLDDPSCLQRMLVQSEESGAPLPVVSRKPINWHDSVRQLLSQIQTALEQSSSPKLRRSA